MSKTPRILALGGSLRKESYNKKLVQIAARAAREAGAEVTYLDLRDYPMPVFDEDLEKAEGLPEGAKKLKQVFIDHDGFLWSCPEYNSSITAVLKNTIDWVSRPVAGETPLRGFKGKTAALMSASPGALGGLRGLVTVRSILSNIGVLVLPTQVAVARAKEAFTPEGALKDPSQQASIEGLSKELVAVLKKLTA
jgi:chromate reductase